MAIKTIKPSELDKAVKDILAEYGDNVTEGVKAAVKRVAKIANKETKAGSNVKTGAYKKGWAVKEEAIDRLQTTAIVHNRTRYQLAHLLEKGHALRRGGRTYGSVKAFPHIEKAEKNAIMNLEKAVEQIAKEG